MYQANFLDTLSLPILFLLTVVFIAVAAEGGYLLGRSKLKQLAEGETPHLGAAVASTLGLLAFMLAFTFGAGTSRLDERRMLVLESSNAVDTAYLRTDLLSEPYRAESRALLAEYIDLLLDAVSLDEEIKEVQAYEVLSRNAQALKRMHQRLWSVAVTAAREDPRPTNSLYIAALNNVFDLAQKRFTVSVQQRMPRIFWILLFGLAGLALGLAGYDYGVSRSQRNLAIWLMALAFASVIVLVLAIDRPSIFRVSQSPLLDLQAEIRGQPGQR